ncbi:MAG TPA: MFS transporter [Acidobacteriaceae bacterium]|nr:MFS transporter [Acidobacteriaceae bacterium]
MSVSATALEAHSTRGVTLRILPTSLQIFLCYFAIGLPMAVLPGVVHLRLHFNTILAGLAISFQYVATVLSRPQAGRMADTVGARRTVLSGLLACGAAGLCLFSAGFFRQLPLACLAIILLSRLILGFGESWLATGASLWGIARVGQEHTAKVISWSGICSYGGLAIGAPVGVWIWHAWGLQGVGLVSAATSGIGVLTAWPLGEAPVAAGEPLAFRQVLSRVMPHGFSLALATTGFGTIASFMVLFYAHNHWSNAAYALTSFGASFVLARLLFAHVIDRFGGFRVSFACLTGEIGGLLFLWLAHAPAMAFAGAALTGFGFSLVFPSLGVEAVNCVSPENRGSALGVYTAFADLSLGLTGPLAGLIVAGFGYSNIFLFAAVAAMFALGIALSLHRRTRRPLPGGPFEFAGAD